MPITTRSVTVDAGQIGRVDLVVRRVTDSSRSQAAGMIDHGCVSINGVRCDSTGKTVAIGDVVAVCYNTDQRYKEKKRSWDDRTFRVVFEDSYLIVVDKSAGTLTVPTENNERNSLVDRVSVYLSHSRGNRDAWVVHRLDRVVSGLLVFGKEEIYAKQLIEQFKHQKPERRYIAIVAGVVSEDEGTFRDHLATGNNLDRYVTAPSKGTEVAVTHYKVLKRMSDTTLVEIRLETGKRNQIRVQFAQAGHPVIGDPRYKKDQATHRHWVRSRIALHANLLSFRHPVTGEPMTFESPVPPAMEKFGKHAG